MAVQVNSSDVPKLMVGALVGLGAVFVLIVVLNHMSIKGGVGAEVGR